MMCKAGNRERSSLQRYLVCRVSCGGVAEMHTVVAPDSATWVTISLASVLYESDSVL